MDPVSSTMSCELIASTTDVKRTLVRYFLNTIRKRNIDEQLNDLSKILECPLDLKIAYDNTRLKVRYSIGSIHASVVGMNESACVRECKRNLLHELQVFCHYIKRGSWTTFTCGSPQVSCNECPDSSITQDVYSEIELCRENAVGEKNAQTLLGGIELVDSEMDIPSELCEFMNNRGSQLTLNIVYYPTEWVMSYATGPYRASAECRRETTCMRRCKLEMLHGIASFVHDEHVFTAENVVEEEEKRSSTETQKTPIEEDNNDEGYQLQDHCEDEKSHSVNVFNGEPAVIIESPEVSEPSVVSMVESGHSSSESTPVTCPVSWNDTIATYEKDLLAQNELIRCEPSSRTNENEVETAAQLPETKTDPTIVTELPTVTRSTEKSNTSYEMPKVLEEYACRTSKILSNVSWPTFQESAKRFSDIILQTYIANRNYLMIITNCIMSNAIENPEKCKLYAELCCYVLRIDWGTTVSQDLSEKFKMGLAQSCRNVLYETGVLSRSGGRSWNSQQPESFDTKASERTHGTCRLMGQLFIRGKLFKTVMDTVITLRNAHDAHSLECLCVLLIVIGSKLEEMVAIRPDLLYEQLKIYSATGHAGNVSLPRRTIDMIDVVLNERRRSCTTSTNPRPGVFAQRNITQDNRRRCQWYQNGANRITVGNGPNLPHHNTATFSRQRQARVMFIPSVPKFFYPARQ